jgi:hypothetical protein
MVNPFSWGYFPSHPHKKCFRSQNFHGFPAKINKKAIAISLAL